MFAFCLPQNKFVCCLTNFYPAVYLQPTKPLPRFNSHDIPQSMYINMIYILIKYIYTYRFIFVIRIYKDIHTIYIYIYIVYILCIYIYIIYILIFQTFAWIPTFGQVLLPIITSPSFHVHGDVVHTALIRLADVLQVRWMRRGEPRWVYYLVGARKTYGYSFG